MFLQTRYTTFQTKPDLSLHPSIKAPDYVSCQSSVGYNPQKPETYDKWNPCCLFLLSECDCKVCHRKLSRQTSRRFKSLYSLSLVLVSVSFALLATSSSTMSLQHLMKPVYNLLHLFRAASLRNTFYMPDWLNGSISFQWKGKSHFWFLIIQVFSILLKMA